MKKFYVYNEATDERDAVYFDFGGKFDHVLGVEFIMETGGDPVTSEEEDATVEELMKQAITEVIDCNEQDEEYITELCEAWGLI